MSFESRIHQHWYGAPGWLRVLLPLEWFYRSASASRRWAFRSGLRRSEKIAVPVVVVGNVTVGGTGKTPIVVALCAAFKRAGHHPGIISRGYGAEPPHWPFEVTPQTKPADSGDEPLLLALSTDCPVVIAPDRVAAAKFLLEQHACDVIISDDGLQHYRLQRDFEIAVIDGRRGLGNGHCLPVGPLREDASRLDSVDAVLVNTPTADAVERQAHYHAFHLQPRAFVALDDGSEILPADWPKLRVHAVAGIGNPGRFFDTLRGLGLDVIEHVFPDHHPFVAGDLAFADALPVVMTEKDAVKCVALERGAIDCWYLAVDAVLPDFLITSLIGRIASL
ncbi:MAG: tetraacyldisaccharide 4'-kinase [Spongiibacteraceae bacterium]